MERTPNRVSTPPETRITDVRERVLAEHTKLRVVITEVDKLASAVAAGETNRLETLRERAAKLYRMLTEHIEHEKTVLAPIIERIDAWGPVRLEQMQHDHV